MSAISIVSFGGKNITTTITNKASVIDEWVAEIMQQQAASGGSMLVGVETERKAHVLPPIVDEDDDDYYTALINSEWVSHYTQYDYGNNAATLQLCVDTKCLIIQLFHLDRVPQSLKDFLRCQNFTFVGVHIIDYTSQMMSDNDMYWNLNTKDLQGYAVSQHPRKCFFWGGWPSIKRLAKEFVGLDMPTPDHVCRSDWEVKELSREQVEYACIDAYASYCVGCKFFN